MKGIKKSLQTRYIARVSYVKTKNTCSNTPFLMGEGALASISNPVYLINDPYTGYGENTRPVYITLQTKMDARGAPRE